MDPGTARRPDAHPSADGARPARASANLLRGLAAAPSWNTPE
ncbi:MAG: hypothetical protein ACK59M_07275 [Pseudomonadota bacterium]